MFRPTTGTILAASLVLPILASCGTPTGSVCRTNCTDGTTTSDVPRPDVPVFTDATDATDAADVLMSDALGSPCMRDSDCSGGTTCQSGHCACPSPQQTACGTACVDTSNDPMHCGSCVFVCPMPAHGTATCRIGVCMVACAAGYHACGLTCASDTDVNACGSSCVHCAAGPSNGFATCSSGMCGFACNPGFHPCGSACARNDDVATCGALCTPCVPPANATATCDGVACGHTCDAGFHDCSGACSDSTSVLSCGASCSPCPAPANGTPTCTSGVCGLTCDAGYYVTGTTCSPVPPPRLIAPLSTATVTSRRPTLHWTLAFGTSGAHVVLCRDRACTMTLASFDATGSSGAPSMDLPPGTVFWRAQGRVGTSTGTATTPTWQFTVGTRTAPVDVSWGTTPDVNGDGFADVLASSNGSASMGAVYVFLGSASGLSTSPATTLTGPDGTSSGFGIVASAGDVNGDGFGDIIVSAPHVATTEGRVHVYLGSASGLATTPATTITGTEYSMSTFGSSISSAGDVNGDGYADIVVGAYQVMTSTGRAYVYLGSATGLSTAYSLRLVGPDGINSNFGRSVASAGDVNGDGFGDVVVGADFANSYVGRAYVYLGRAPGLSSVPAVTLTGPYGAGGQFGAPVSGAGDVNGDGYADIVIASRGADSTMGRAYVYGGSATGIAATPTTTLLAPDAFGDFSNPVASAGDVNADGFGDVVIGGQGAMGAGRAYVFHGGATGLSTSPATTLVGMDGPSANFGLLILGAGDVNSDGFGDVVASARAAMGNLGRVYVFDGGVSGIGTTPSASLTGTDVNGNFGLSLASAPLHSVRRGSMLAACGTRRSSAR